MIAEKRNLVFSFALLVVGDTTIPKLTTICSARDGSCLTSWPPKAVFALVRCLGCCQWQFEPAH